MTLVSRPPTVVASSSGTTNHAQNLWLLPEAGPLPSTTAPALHHLSTRRCHHPQGRDKRLALGSFRPLQKTCVIALWGIKRFITDPGAKQPPYNRGCAAAKLFDRVSGQILETCPEHADLWIVIVAQLPHFSKCIVRVAESALPRHSTEMSHRCPDGGN